MFAIFVGALLGGWFGGWKGLLLGGVIAYVASRFAQTALHNRVNNVRSEFLDATFAVMGAVCKADGVVSRDEIRTVEAMFVRMNFSEQQKVAAKVAFNRGKAPGFDLDGEVTHFAQSARGNAILVQMFLQLQFAAVAADGQVHPVEREMLVRIARLLGLAEQHIAQLEALLRAAGSVPSEGEAAAPHRPTSQSRLNDAYTALGLTPEATEAEIKRAYRKMISETHPDKLASQGLPQNMRELAEERARELNVAYELIKRARNFT
jgi:DnaJ like chaperone protein